MARTNLRATATYGSTVAKAPMSRPIDLLVRRGTNGGNAGKRSIRGLLTRCWSIMSTQKKGFGKTRRLMRWDFSPSMSAQWARVPRTVVSDLWLRLERSLNLGQRGGEYRNRNR